MNEYERRLLTRAREIVESGSEQFVCLAIEDAHYEFSGNFKGVPHYETAMALRSQVQRSLEGQYTFQAYFYSKYGYRPERNDIIGRRDNCDFWDGLKTVAKIVYLPTDEFYSLIRQARLAWIDRMLDNNEVA